MLAVDLFQEARDDNSLSYLRLKHPHFQSISTHVTIQILPAALLSA